MSATRGRSRGGPPDDLLDAVDAYLDAAPRSSARAVDVAAFRVFVAEGSPWPFYARPRRDHPAPTADDVASALAYLRAHDLPESFEWVHERTPALGDLLADAGLRVVLHPLLVAPDGVGRADGGSVAGVAVRVLDADDPALPAAQVVAELGFAAPGTGVGPAGPADRDARLAVRDPSADDHVRSRVASGLSVVAVVETDEGVVATGTHQPVGDASEIVGVATLPSHRRRGLAGAVVAALAADAVAHGVGLLLLSAGDDDVARVYERVGFARVGHAGAAEPG
ncbi:MAG: GNAT family N-acetyltransferase [Candidatus Nanopelagicales bacterium]